MLKASHSKFVSAESLNPHHPNTLQCRRRGGKAKSRKLRTRQKKACEFKPLLQSSNIFASLRIHHPSSRQAAARWSPPSESFGWQPARTWCLSFEDWTFPEDSWMALLSQKDAFNSCLSSGTHTYFLMIKSNTGSLQMLCKYCQRSGTAPFICFTQSPSVS